MTAIGSITFMENLKIGPRFVKQVCFGWTAPGANNPPGELRPPRVAAGPEISAGRCRGRERGDWRARDRISESRNATMKLLDRRRDYSHPMPARRGTIDRRGAPVDGE